MESVVQKYKKELEARGEYVKMANTGWSAFYSRKWQALHERARRDGRMGPNLVVYMTNSNDMRDHYVIPSSVIRDIFFTETITTSGGTLPSCQNFTLQNGKLHVLHRPRKIDVSKYHGARLIVELEIEQSENNAPEEVTSDKVYREGAVRWILINSYERDPVARKRCIDYYGRCCTVCRKTFAEMYGPEFSNIVHVHHIIPLSEIGKEYEIDPIKDLRPVCPNCHAVIHSRKPARSIEDVAKLFR